MALAKRTLSLYREDMIAEELINFLEHLVPSNKEVGTTSNIVTLPQLYSLAIRGYPLVELSCSAIVAMVGALSCSNLPLFGYPYKKVPKMIPCCKGTNTIFS